MAPDSPLTFLVEPLDGVSAHRQGDRVTVRVGDVELVMHADQALVLRYQLGLAVNVEEALPV